MSRLSIGGAFAMFLIGLAACCSSAEEKDPDVTKGCEALCDAQSACGIANQGDVSCVDACTADVGTPGVECGKALEAWAACVKADCEAPCTDEEDARATACGGTG